MKFDYRRSIAAHKISHRRLLSPRVGSRVQYSRLLCHKNLLWKTFRKPLHNKVPFTHAVHRLHSV